MEKLNDKRLSILLGLESINLEDGPITLATTLASGPKEDRLKAMRENDDEKATIAAAIEIQRTWRGYRIRMHKKKGVMPGGPAVDTLSYVEDSGAVENQQPQYGDIDYSDDGDEEDEEKQAGSIGQLKHAEDKSEEKSIILDEKDDTSARNEDVPRSKDIPLSEPVASEISQEPKGDWDLSLQTDFDASYNQEDVMALSSHAVEGTRTDASLEPLTQRDAAIIIQRSWRRHIDTQVYRYYRDLINFKTRGDPMLMLRCINPNEAKLLDPAAGIHLRFRLAGQRFPPNIYYKIYTHRPVVDMCANSPKDYTAPASKTTTAKDTHSKHRQVVDPQSRDGWYQRIDNNGWRLVSDRLISHIMSDTVTWETSQKKYEFSHDKLQRKQDVERRRKQKKITWMRKMYKDGMLKARAKDPETVKLIEGAALGMVETAEKLGPEALEDWEVDELLEWTTNLNFDDYLVSWKDIATSADSEKKVVDRLQIRANSTDPYEMTISTGPSRFQSTRQSHNTPVSSSVSNKHWVSVG